MSKKLKIHDGDTLGKTFEVKLEYPKPKVATMSDMKCPYCGELLDFVCDENENPDITHCLCLNTSCNFFGEGAPTKIWRDLIAGKKAQRQLRTVKDRCVKKVKAKEREIYNYLNGISVRQSENERLEKQLKQAQSELNYYKGLNCPNVVEKQMQTITSIAKQVKSLQEMLSEQKELASMTRVPIKQDTKWVLVVV